VAPSDDTDDALIAQARDGDEQAFASLYRRHRDWVIRIAWRITGSRDDALDVLQDAFTYLFRKVADPTFALSTTLRGFLYPTVRHLALDRRRRRSDVDVDDLADVLPAPPDPTTGTAHALRTALSTLPPAQREVVVRRFADDLSLQQIAEASGVPLGTVKSRLHHALAAIRRALRGD
jgi:RNA polymerase sigma-70 factor (ECF subfamily)